MTVGFSMSLSLLKVGVQDCVGKGTAHLVGQLGEVGWQWFLVLFSLAWLKLWSNLTRWLAVSSSLFLANRVCDSSLPVCVRWSDLLFSPGSSWVAPQLQLLLVSFPPDKLGQFSFMYHPWSHKISSAIHHATTLGGWLVTPPQLSVFFPCPAPAHRVQFLVPFPHSLRLVCHSIMPPLSVANYNSLSMLSSFV
jgi:hypothetical protein